MFVAKSIDELYEEVKDFDLVMCNDAPLALALNNRLDKPRVGAFAITPRQLAGDLAIDILGEPILSDIEVVKKLVEYTGYPLRFVHGEVENFKAIRRYTREVRHYLKTDKSRELYDEYIRLPTLEKAMDAVNGHTDPFFVGKKIAVIGLNLYDSLDQNFNPPEGSFEYIRIYKNPFKEGTYEIPCFRELYNDHQIAENVVSMINKENAKDVAIVMDVNGKIADAVRSELYRNEIPFINELSMRDLNNIRDFIEFIDRSLNFKIAKVSQIRELVHSYGGFILPLYDEYLIENFEEFVKDDTTRDILGTMRDISGYTYGDVCSKILKSDSAQVRMLLDQLRIADAKVNFEDTAEMIYSVNNFELKHNEQIPNTEKEGVLLVDCNNSVYIDRPVVYYLGLGPEWEGDLSDLNLIDYKMKDDLIRRNICKFQILLQQGTTRVYVCNSVKNGKKAVPCKYFEKAYNCVYDGCKPIKDENGDEVEMVYKEFRDITDNVISGPWHHPEEKHADKMGILNIDRNLKDFEFSSTSYKEYRTCPKKFMFYRLVKSPDESAKVLGTLLHNYAEFRTCFPDKAKELGQEFFVREISDICMPLLAPEIRKLRESKIRTAVSEIDDLVTNYRLDEGVVCIDKDRDRENVFFEMFGYAGKGSDHNEVLYEDRDRHMNGTFDLIKDDRIFDFKTGNHRKTVSSVKDELRMDKKSDYGKDFQSLFYLSLLMKAGYDRPTFTYFSTSANEVNDALGRERDPESALVNITVVEDRIECIRKFFPIELYAKTSKDYDVYKPYCDYILQTVLDWGLDEAFADVDNVMGVIIDHMGVSDNKTRRTKLGVVLNIIKNIWTGDYYSRGNTIYVTKGEMERFRNEVEEAYVTILKSYDTEFKGEIMMECKNCSYKDMCITFDEGGVSDE